jgi:hypothetical protein
MSESRANVPTGKGVNDGCRDDYSAKTRTAGHRGMKTTVHVRWHDELPSAVSGIDARDIGVADQTC